MEEEGKKKNKKYTKPPTAELVAEKRTKPPILEWHARQQ